MRMQALLAVMAGLGLGALSVAQDAAKNESEVLRGRWTAVAAINAEGKAETVAEDDPKHFTFEFTQDKLITKLKNASIEGAYKLDPAKSPKAIDLVRRRGGKELIFRGIYAVVGDRLRFCLAGPGEERPKEFKQGEGIEFAVELKRVKPPAEQAEIISAIKKLGGVVEIDEQRPGKPVVKVDLHETKVTDADLEILESLTELRTLDLRLTKITDAGVSRLKGLKELRFVNLFRTQLSDEGLKHLTGNKDLETLLIGGTKITDKGLAHLMSFPKLKKLSVFDTQIGDAGLTHLTGLSDLEVLLIGKSKVTDEGAKAIQKAVPKLRFKESIG